MAGYLATISIALAAAVSNGIAQSQSGTAATALTLNGSLVSGGVATMDIARRVIVTGAGNESSNTFTITGTDRYGRLQSEALTGAGSSTAAVSTKDYLTVTSIVPTNNTASTVTAGTNGTASTAPYIVDSIANPTNIGLGAVVSSGSPTYTVEQAYDDLSPAWDVTNNPPTWYAVSGFSSQTSNQNGAVTSGITMLRLTNNSGTGAKVILHIVQGLLGGGF